MKYYTIFGLLFAMSVCLYLPPRIQDIKIQAVSAEEVKLEPVVLVEEPHVQEDIGTVGEKFLKMLYLDEPCHYMQSSDQHVVPGRGSVYAVDIVCVTGQPFEVKAPSWQKEYRVERIGFDERLGNYMILKNGEYHVVFGHVSPIVKEGALVHPGKVLGNTNISGISSGVHVHVEIWKDTANAKPAIILGEKVEKNTLSSKILEQRGWRFSDRKETALNIATPLIMKWECPRGPALTAYKDLGGDGWTIGCGTKSYPGEIITKNEAISRFKGVLSNVVNMVLKDFPNATARQQAALVSLAFNCHSGYSAVVKEGLQKQASVCSTAVVNKKRIKLGGLVKRRADETSLINY